MTAHIIYGMRNAGKFHLSKDDEERPACGLNHFALYEVDCEITPDWVEENADNICKRCYDICEESIFETQ